MELQLVFMYGLHLQVRTHASHPTLFYPEDGGRTFQHKFIKFCHTPEDGSILRCCQAQIQISLMNAQSLYIYDPF
jgi:hypothetical protein